MPLSETGSAPDGSADERPVATDAEHRAVASGLRLRILRMTLDEALTNKEIATRLGRNPASTLHHVRTLLDTGFLVAEEERRGARGAREIPYRATGKSWRLRFPREDASQALAMLDAFLDESRAAGLSRARMTRLGLRLTPEELEEFERRVGALMGEYAARPPSPDGQPWSVFVAVHPDPGRD